MTWTINFDVVDGGVDAESIRVGGTPPDGPVSVNGHQHHAGRNVAVTVAGASVSAFIPTAEPAAKAELPEE